MRTLLGMALPLALTVAITGCTNKELYQFGQDQQESQCISEAVSESQINDCKSANKPSYEEYKKEREAVVSS
ncbi:hypothetical protein [Shewanella woodyi]|uniref:hypothetical protein n=1 Tax=Shewanella woodyi TaxID=60961 RepID=UPI0007F9722D|nr:hypothetical protein [Shewanella woodyi]